MEKFDKALKLLRELVDWTDPALGRHADKINDTRAEVYEFLEQHEPPENNQVVFKCSDILEAKRLYVRKNTPKN